MAGKNHLKRSDIGATGFPRYVKIKAERGYGDAVWLIVGEDYAHFDLKEVDGTRKVHIYKAHCKGYSVKTGLSYTLK